jgi:hypothetical protein
VIRDVEDKEEKVRQPLARCPSFSISQMVMESRCVASKDHRSPTVDPTRRVLHVGRLVSAACTPGVARVVKKKGKNGGRHSYNHGTARDGGSGRST